MAIKVSRLLHASYLFDFNGVRILFDPLFESPFSYNCYAFPEIQFDFEKLRNHQFDAVFISHFHDDHCSLESLNKLNKKTPIYLYCVFEELFEMIRALGFESVHALTINSPVTIGDFIITPRRALDADVDSLFHIQAGDHHVLNVVDSWIDPETLELLAQTNWDLVLWPFQTMRELEVLSPRRAQPPEIPSEWREQLQRLNPNHLVPSSCQFQMETWSWYNEAFFPISYKKFESYIEDILPKTKFVRLNPGVSILLKSTHILPVERLDLIIPDGEQDRDYHYNPNLIPPPTSDIAQHFKALSEDEKSRTLEFCGEGLINAYKDLDLTYEPYLQGPLHWKLSLYDHAGVAFDFYYQINGSKLLRIENKETFKVGWLTEVPINKVYSALTEGESLSSMYVRINDCDFPEEIEKEICEVDLLEDPLLRCLFNREFGSYQKAQLKKIKES